MRNTLDYIAPLCQKYLNNHGEDYDVIILTKFMYSEIEGQDTLLLTHPRARVVEKSTYSAYTEETRRILADAQITEVHVAGVDAEMSVLATMYSMVDAGFDVKVLEKLVGSYHGRNWESMMIARHCLGKDNVLNIGGDRVWM